MGFKLYRIFIYFFIFLKELCFVLDTHIRKCDLNKRINEHKIDRTQTVAYRKCSEIVICMFIAEDFMKDKERFQ